MNDRFKFRAWNKLSNEMKDVISLNINYEFPDCSNVILETNTFDNIKTHNNPITCANGLNNVVLMQCTGLKDKNGKLIYEGDIVKRYFICRSSVGDIVEENLFTVKFEDLKFGLFQIAILKGCTDYSPFLNFDEALELEEYAEEMEEITLEVIGNIYENPELLEECEDE